MQTDGSRKELVCPVCHRSFVPHRRVQKFCSSLCGKQYYTTRRSKLRALRHKTETRICRGCGTAFTWDSHHSNKQYCTDECKRRHESEARAADRTRTDKILIPADKISKVRPACLDDLRVSKGSDYFRMLFSLPEADQFAEMASWEEADHAAALEYLMADTDDDVVAPEYVFPTEERGDAFDEEDHFND